MTIVEIIQFFVAVRRVLDIIIESQIRKAAAEDQAKLEAIKLATEELSVARSSEEKVNALKKLSASINGADYKP